MLYDKEREDGIFTPKEPSAIVPSPFTSGSESDGSQNDVWNPLDSIYVTMPPWHPAAIASPSTGSKDKTPKNPVSHWRVSKKKIVGSYASYLLDVSYLILCVRRLCVLSRCEICSCHLGRRLSKGHRCGRRTVSRRELYYSVSCVNVILDSLTAIHHISVR